MKIATTKERILQFIDYKGISKQKFFAETGLKRGFLDADKLSTSIPDTFVAIIIAHYPEINIEWLLTGRGSMLKDALPVTYNTGDSMIVASESQETYGHELEAITKERDELRSKLVGTENLLKLVEYKVEIMNERLADKDVLIGLQKKLIDKLEAAVDKKSIKQP